jgi:hypothetical protein
MSSTLNRTTLTPKKITLLAVLSLMLSLSACGGGSSGGSESTITDSAQQDDDTNDEDNENNNGEDNDNNNNDENTNTNTGNDNGGNTGTVNTGGQFSRTACGGTPVNIAPSTDPDNPGLLLQGQIAQGNVAATGSSSSNYWAFDVPEGSYALAVDAVRSDSDRRTNIGVEVIPTGQFGVDATRFYRSNEIHRQIRHFTFVNKTGTAPGGIRILSAFGEIQYQLALYGVDDEVPVPFLTNCPQARTATTGVTEAFSLGTGNTDMWFEVSLAAGTYDIVIDAALTNGERTNIIYAAHATNAYADIDSKTTLLQVNEIDVTNRSATTLTVDDPGTYFIWVEQTSVNRDYSMEFVINPR